MILLGNKGCKERESGLTIVSRMSDNPEITGIVVNKNLTPRLWHTMTYEGKQQ